MNPIDIINITNCLPYIDKVSDMFRTLIRKHPDYFYQVFGNPAKNYSEIKKLEDTLGVLTEVKKNIELIKEQERREQIEAQVEEAERLSYKDYEYFSDDIEYEDDDEDAVSELLEV